MFRCLLVGILTTLTLSCESGNDISVQEVNSNDLLTETELALQQTRIQQENTKDNTFYFGFDLRASPQEDAAQYLPFLNYLEESTGYHFKLHFTPKNSTTIEQLGNNKIQFAAMGATGFLIAREKYPVISLVRGLNDKGLAKYQSFLVTRPNSKINSVGDLKGKKLAFGSADSTQGHLIPRIILQQHKIDLNELKSYTYTGSHQNCAEAVVSGKYDVCGMQDQLAENFAAQGQLKIIHRSDFYPSSGIVALKSLPNEVIERVKQALLEFDPVNKHSKELHHWDRTEMPGGFIASKETDYEDLQYWSSRLGFLQDKR